MSKKFSISFVTSEIPDNSSRGELFKYKATVTTISGSLGLYKVSNIRRLGDQSKVYLPCTFFITSYPLQNNKEQIWKDPISLSANNLLKIIGEKIEGRIKPGIRGAKLAVDNYN